MPIATSTEMDGRTSAVTCAARAALNDEEAEEASTKSFGLFFVRSPAVSITVTLEPDENGNVDAIDGIGTTQLTASLHSVTAAPSKERCSE